MSTTMLAWAGHYSHAGSDKVWAGAVVGCVFRSTWGKRGSSLQRGEKVLATPALAVAAFTKKQIEKASEGYHAIEFGDPTYGVPYLFDGQQAAGSESLPFASQGRERAVEYVPSHVTKGDEATLAQALADPQWGVSEKLDGERCVCLVADGNVVAFNSKGQRVSAPPLAAQRLLTLGMTCLVDGERLTRTGAGSYALFDCLELAGEDMRPLPYAERMARLEHVLTGADLLTCEPAATLDLALCQPNALYVLTSESDPERGRAVVEEVKARGGEGIIVRDFSGPYIAGDSRFITKCKFVTDVEAFCVRVNPGAATGSVTLGMVRSSDGRIFEVGNVRSGLRDADLGVLGDRIARGDLPVLQVAFLSARTVGLKLVEPRTDISRLREDRTWQECVIDQLGLAKVALFEEMFPSVARVSPVME